MVTIEELGKFPKNTDLIYHYTKVSTVIEFILRNREIRFNSLRNTNDPLEFEDFCMSIGSTPDSPPEDVDRVSREGTRLLEIVKKVCKVCCFSCDYDLKPNDYDSSHIFVKGYCLPRMWSQYGENHFGVCVIFSRSKLQKHATNTRAIHIPGGTDFSLFAKEVKYDNELPGLWEALTLEYDLVKDKSAETMLEKNLDPLLFTKYKNYEHEQEYRIVLHSSRFQNNDIEDIDFGDAIEGIILGTRFKSAYLPSIRKFTDELGIPVFKMSWFNGKAEISEYTYDKQRK